MRIQGEILEFTIKDVDTEDTIVLRYRKPYTRERIGYNTGLWDLEKREFKPDEEVDQNRVEWGYKIVEGLELMTKRMAPISSNPESEHYSPTWKEWLKEKAPQVLEALAFKAFQGVDFNKAMEESPPEKKL